MDLGYARPMPVTLPLSYCTSRSCYKSHRGIHSCSFPDIALLYFTVLWLCFSVGQCSISCIKTRLPRLESSSLCSLLCPAKLSSPKHSVSPLFVVTLSFYPFSTSRSRSPTQAVPAPFGPSSPKPARLAAAQPFTKFTT